jgi:hypothetical protein
LAALIVPARVRALVDFLALKFAGLAELSGHQL